MCPLLCQDGENWNLLAVKKCKKKSWCFCTSFQTLSHISINVEFRLVQHSGPLAEKAQPKMKLLCRYQARQWTSVWFTLGFFSPKDLQDFSKSGIFIHSVCLMHLLLVGKNNFDQPLSFDVQSRTCEREITCCSYWKYPAHYREI